MGNPSREMETIEKNQVEILELKSISKIFKIYQMRLTAGWKLPKKRLVKLRMDQHKSSYLKNRGEKDFFQ